MSATRIIALTQGYETDITRLSGGVWTVGDTVYLTPIFDVINNATYAVTEIGDDNDTPSNNTGEIGSVLETPDSCERLVIRLSVTDTDLVMRIKTLTSSTDL